MEWNVQAKYYEKWQRKTHPPSQPKNQYNFTNGYFKTHAKEGDTILDTRPPLAAYQSE